MIISLREGNKKVPLMRDLNYHLSVIIYHRGEPPLPSFALLRMTIMLPLPYNFQLARKYRSNYDHHRYYLLLQQMARIYFVLHTTMEMQPPVLYTRGSIHWRKQQPVYAAHFLMHCLFYLQHHLQLLLFLRVC